MKAVGIIAEYNPFHNGHAYHVREAKRMTNDAVVVAIMSGSFLQRGEPALLDKWTRAYTALRGGVDVVIELPFRYAVSAAHEFATGGIELLHALGVEQFCFGSEDGKVAPFLQAAQQSLRHDTAIRQQVQTRYDASFAASYEAAFQTSAKYQLDIQQPNNSLGFHYVRANERLPEPMDVFTVQREQAHYHDDTIHHPTIASATAIRKQLLRYDTIESIERTVPLETFQQLIQYEREYAQQFGRWDIFYPFVRATLLRSTPQQLASIFTVREGIEHRLIRAAAHATTFEQFMHTVKTKRFSWAAIQRMLTHIAIGTTYEEVDTNAFHYARILGFSERGSQWLKKAKRRASIPMITNVNRQCATLLDLDIRATTLYTLFTKSERESETIHVDYSRHPIFPSF